jgi:hypothetical protein
MPTDVHREQESINLTHLELLADALGYDSKKLMPLDYQRHDLKRASTLGTRAAAPRVEAARVAERTGAGAGTPPGRH